MQLDDDFLNELKALDIDLDDLVKNALNKTELLLKDGFIVEAEILVKQLLRVSINNLQGMQLYGLILFRKREYKEAIDVITQAIAMHESNAENHNNIALCYLHSGQSEKAFEHVSRAVELAPDNYNFTNNKGLICRARGDLVQAIKYFKQAIEKSDNSRAWENLGSVYGQQKKLDDAIDCFQKAISLDADNLGAHVDLAYAHHLKGNWEKGWEEYEYRLEYWHSVGRNPGKFYDIYPPSGNWDGKESIANKKIVIYCEQGSGDMINFVRFVPLLKDLGAEVVIDAPPELKSLFEGFGAIRTNYSDVLEYDYHCSILSLPYLLKVKDNFMKETSYLGPISAHPSMVDYDKFFKIGVVWAGNPGHPNDANRSVYLKNFKGIANLPNVKLFSFQKELGNRVYANSNVQIDLMENCEDMRLVDLSGNLDTFKDTAELVMGMDLMITVDTSVLHLAGALGKKTFALIPYNPDWRWGIEGSDNNWYSSVTLFRQEDLGDWKTVFDKVEEQVRDLLPNK